MDARLRTWAVGLAGAFVVVVFAFASEVIFVLFAGILFAIFIRTIASWLCAKTGVPYTFAAAATLTAIIGVSASGILALGPSIDEQLRLLSVRLPRITHSVLHQLQHLPGWARDVVGQPSASDLRPEAGTVVSGASDFVAGATLLLGALVVIFFLGLYGALSPESHTRVALAVVPAEHRERAEAVLVELADTLGRWLIGRMVAMLFVGVFTAIGLALLRVPVAVGLGIVAGLLTFVEYLGAVVSAIPACLIALAVSPLHVLWVIVLFTVVHIVEGYILTPLIARQAVHFPPAYTLGAQLILGGLFGVLGLTFATPLCVVLVVVVNAFRKGASA
jgi:predicted PurR-regulated permease PerM